MREIIFRGKTNGGKWVYGSLLNFKDKVAIMPIQTSGKKRVKYYEVEKESVGQFTGAFAKYKKKIFEDDILQDEKGILQVEFDPIFGIWMCRDKETNASSSLYQRQNHLLIKKMNFNILGNVTENESLLLYNEEKTIQDIKEN